LAELGVAAVPGTTERGWLLWQLVDSAFPAGGFAHSGGLEAAWQTGEIRSRDELASFIAAGMGQIGKGALPFLAETHVEPREFAQTDRLCDTFLSNHVANRASRAQGQAWLIAAERAFSSAPIIALRQEVLASELPGHVAPVFGALTRSLEVPLTAAQRLFLFLALRSYIASAVRLGIVGALEGQAIQARLAPQMERIHSRCGDLRARDATQTTPLLEIWQGGHDRLYSRLFQS
jgi:urease accessory protein